MAATSALGIAVLLTFISGNAVVALFPAAVAALLVFRLGTTPLIAAYTGGFLLASLLVSSGLVPSFDPVTKERSDDTVLVQIIVAIVTGGIGLALRLAYARGQRLEHELAERAEREREAVLAERRWIAGELHDSIAHHLTIVALHVQLLDDEAARHESQEAIRVAARKALSDLRFVIQLAEDAPSGTEVPSGDLAAAIEEASQEFEATGRPTICDGDPRDEGIPRGVEIILARIVRESATNILKYAGPGEIRIGLLHNPDSVSLTIRSPLPTVARRDLPSTGTGLNRMAERVLGVSGEFSAGPVDDAWLVSVTLPVAPGANKEIEAPAEEPVTAASPKPRTKVWPKV
ncbi:sensor histidine kinase [Tessaracoccus caeni]|uniref:sensor histidine kinase n=1 Tax=Tessaracoccus caeni TaxID=3031239 RepID=UPI0023DCBBAF|nr:histidine kinase [Tessaracoccus caeni]MDF1490258.1 histidine kinase [Tessaracoccus caeni]